MSADSSSLETASENPKPTNARHLRAKAICIALVFLADVLLVTLVFLAGPNSVSAFSALNLVIGRILLLVWALYDAGQRGYQYGEYFVPSILVFPGPLIAGAAYFYHSRPKNFRMLAILLLIGFFILRLSLVGLLSEFLATYLRNR